MKTLKRIYQYKLESIVLLVLVFEFMFPHYSLAAAAQQSQESVSLPQEVIQAEENATIQLVRPIREYQVVKTYYLPVTAYSSTPDQTDSTPCITANGFNLCEHDREDVIAANFLPFGTKVRIPEYFGDRIFYVQDRMNSRYYYRTDIWMKNRTDALKFGLRYATIEVVE